MMAKGVCISFLATISAVCLLADEPGNEVRLVVPEGWRGERISLPPEFAPGMKLRGIEEIRFAPGMFEAKSESFFSYVFVFQLDPKPALSRQLIERELLVYYRGLAMAVLKDREVDVESFTLTLTKTEVAESDAPQPNELARYSGDLKWLEPFVTREKQTLHLEVEAWQDEDGKHSYLFVCASPAAPTIAIWKEMRGIRESFYREK